MQGLIKAHTETDARGAVPGRRGQHQPRSGGSIRWESTATGASNKQGKRYSKEFKRDAVGLARSSSNTVTEVARDVTGLGQHGTSDLEVQLRTLGAIFGPLLALVLVAWFGVTWAIGLSAVPGLLAAAAIIYAIRQTPRPTSRDKVPLKIRIRPVLKGDLGRLLGAVAAFEVGNVAATLLILRASELLAPERGTKTATTIALGLYTAYNVAATIASIPAGRLSDRLRKRGPVLVLAGGVAAFALAYGLFTLNSPAVAVLAVPFMLAGVGIGAFETAQHSAVAALAPKDLRGSAFGMLATVQSLGNLAASTVAGVPWTAVSPTAAFTYLTARMLLALVGLLVSARRRGHRCHRLRARAESARLLGVGKRQPPVEIPDEPGQVRAAGSVGDVAVGPDQAVRDVAPWARSYRVPEDPPDSAAALA